MPLERHVRIRFMEHAQRKRIDVDMKTEAHSACMFSECLCLKQTDVTELPASATLLSGV
jgi:hypothetical protein